MFISTFIFGQNNCQYSVKIKNDNLKNTGLFTLSIMNVGNESFKIPKELNVCNMRLKDLEFFNEETNSFEKMKMGNKDIDCFTYRNKDKNLKPQKTHSYTINIKSDFEVLQNSKFFETSNNRKYRFKLIFSLDSYNRCGESNTLITDWIYKN